MTWFFLIIIAITFISFARLLQKRMLQNFSIDSVGYATLLQYIVTIIIFFYSLIGGIKFYEFVNFIPNIILMVILYGLGSAILFYAFKYEEVSIVTVVFASSNIFATLSSVLFLGENLSMQRIIGIIIILIGVVIVNLNQQRQFIFTKWAFYALIASVIYGFAFTNDAYILSNNRDIPTYLTMSYLFPAVFLTLIFPKNLISVAKNFNTKNYIELFVIAFLVVISTLSSYKALQLSNSVSLISALSQLSIIFTVILSVIFLRENENKNHKIIGSICAIFGAIWVVM